MLKRKTVPKYPVQNCNVHLNNCSKILKETRVMNLALNKGERLQLN